MILHVIIIGSASNHSSHGQLPDPNELKKFTDSLKNKVLITFCDPSHYANENDNKIFSQYTELKIPFEVLHKDFNIERIDEPSRGTEPAFKLSDGDHCLFIDCAGVSDSEYSFVKLYDPLVYTKWKYKTLGCFATTINIQTVFDETKDIKYSTIKSKINLLLSPKYRENLYRDLANLLSIKRALNLVPMPAWVRERDDIPKDSPEQIKKYIENIDNTVGYFIDVNGGCDYTDLTKSLRTICNI